MSPNRHSTQSANELIQLAENNQIVAREILMQAGEHDAQHSHPWHQLLFPRQGMLRTRVLNKQYFIPSNRAMLIPAGSLHESWSINSVQFIGIYFKTEMLEQPVATCQVIEVSPLFNQMIYQVYKITSQLSLFSVKEKRLIQVFYDQLTEQKQAMLEIILPEDRRLKKMVSELLVNPASNKKLTDWAKQLGASERTISRVFESQTGLTFRQWRHRMRMISSLPMIEQNTPIQTVALNVGYESTSAFIHSFKKQFGQTPLQYFG